MKSEINDLLEKLEDSFNGDPWYGESLMHKLENIDFEIANSTPEGISNSIANLVQHIINWRVYLIEKLKGNVEYAIELNTSSDWSNVEINSKGDWTKLKSALEDTQDEITGLLQVNDDEFLELQVPGRSYNFKFLIEGIIQHDIYHTGQIAIVARQASVLKSKP